LAASPDFARDAMFFAATMAGLYRSKDGGKSWQSAGTSLPGPFLTSVVVSPAFAEDGVVLASSLEGGVFRSADGGKTWAPGDFRGRPVNVSALEVSPDFLRDGMAFAGTMADGVFRSTDRGATWDSSSFGLLDLNVQDLATSPAFGRDETVYAATTSGVFHSHNGGRAWREVAFPLGAGSVQCLACSPDFSVDGTLFAGTEAAGIYRSTDRGRTWQASGDALANACINAVAISPDYPRDGTLLVATESGIYASRDAGQRWRRCAELPGALCLALAPTFAAGGPAMAGLPRTGAHRSSEGLASWPPANDGLAGRVLAGLALSPAFADDRRLFAFGPSEGVIQSADGGLTWSDSSVELPSLQVDDLAGAPDRNGETHLYAALAQGLWVSRGWGEGWRQVSDLPAQRVRLSPGFPQDSTLVVATKDQGLRVSRDAGQNWEPVDVPWNGQQVLALALSPAFLSDASVFVTVVRPDAESAEIWQGAIGKRWKPVIRYRGTAHGAVLAVPASYPHDGHWYASIGAQFYRPQAGVERRRSREVRRAIEGQALAPERPTVLDLAVLPNSQPDFLLAATERGLYASADGGASWGPIDDGLPARPFVAIAPSPNYARDRSIYALELGGNLWRLNRSS